MTDEVKHYPHGPSGAHRWLICTDAPNAEAGYPNETTDAADEGTAAHWLLEQCLGFGWTAEEAALKFDGVVPASKETGTLKEWPITGEMIEAVQTHLDEVARWAGFPKLKRGARLWAEERVMVPAHYGLAHPVGGTADTIVYLMRSKTLVVIDFKYGKGHVVEIADETFPINPQVGLYLIAALGQLERLLGKPAEVNWVVGGIVQPRAYHKKGPVRTKKLSPFQLMGLEGAMIDAVNGAKVRVAGEHCHWCRAKPDCAEFHAHRSELATGGFEAEVPEDLPPNVPAVAEEPAVDNLPALVSRPVKGLTLQDLAKARAVVGPLKAWLKEVEEEVRTRLLHDLQVPGARLAQGKGQRAYGGSDDDVHEAIVATVEQLGIEEDELIEPPKLKSPAQLEKELGKARFKETPLAALVTYAAGGPVVVDEGSDKPAYVKDNGFEAEVPPETPIESPLL